MEINGSEINHGKAHAEELEEIIEKSPTWILNWGITIVFLVILMVVALAEFVKYPETYIVKTDIISDTAPQLVALKQRSRIQRVFVSKGALVKKGQTLGSFRDVRTGAEQAITANTDGYLRYVGVIEQGRIVDSGQTIFVVHNLFEKYYGILKIPAQDVSKVHEGLNVVTRLDGERQDVSEIHGQIVYISDEPVNDYYSAKVVFADSQSNHNTYVHASHNADSKIILNNITLADRIYRSVLRGLQI